MCAACTLKRARARALALARLCSKINIARRRSAERAVSAIDFPHSCIDTVRKKENLK